MKSGCNSGEKQTGGEADVGLEVHDTLSVLQIYAFDAKVSFKLTSVFQGPFSKNEDNAKWNMKSQLSHMQKRGIQKEVTVTRFQKLKVPRWSDW